LRISTLIGGLCGVLAAACAFSANAVAASACASSYSYAGLSAAAASHGVSARITPLANPLVSKGHVAGWIGVGGDGYGPHGSSEWIQVGLSAFEGSLYSNIYYEVRQPGYAAQYIRVKATVKPGESHRMAVLEVRNKPNAWRVWVDGKPVSPAYYLPGSHTGWNPQATSESWNASTHVCNNFAYSFQGIAVSAKPGGVWHGLGRNVPFQDAGYAMSRRSPAGFVAASSTLLRQLNSNG